jgi:hypothetical protein
MNDRIEDEGLRLALDGVATVADAELEHAAARAMADVERIRRGLDLLAAELPSPLMRTNSTGRGSWQLVALGLGAVAVVVALASVAVLHRGATRATSDQPAAHFLPDKFNYRAGGVGSSASVPGLRYSVPALWDVSAASGRAAWIVGSHYPHTLAWGWNGTVWRNVAMPRVPGDAELHSVATITAGDAWAVGSQSGPSDQFRVTHALVEHWDGTRWTVAAVPGSGPSVLWSVSASSAANVWAVGATLHRDRHGKFLDRGMRPLALHWNGESWHAVSLPWARAGGQLDKVVVTGPTSVWAVSTGSQDVRTIFIEHWDGTRWNAVSAPFGALDPIRGFAATSASDAWAVGGYRQGGHSRTLAAHWNGHIWQIALTPNQNTDSMLTDIAAVSRDDVWALGQSHYLKVTKNPRDCRTPCTEITQSWPVALFEHWNGRRWQIMRGAAPRMWDGGTALTATKDGNAWAAGGCYWDDVITRWNETAWQIAPHPPDRYWRPNTPRRDRRRLVSSCS